ncbi:hypothetical protein KS4_17390 [Poriferisphaera corsica]|uniref:Uncharacterized protein n=1 Tax=Poriferisphaera corsica TaxID=2528020 RepID=A0A517YTY0_9BACT|nr:hypothetical protein KS4_17390 [Poriferisphaera corsica]
MACWSVRGTEAIRIADGGGVPWVCSVTILGCTDVCKASERGILAEGGRVVKFGGLRGGVWGDGGGLQNIRNELRWHADGRDV